MTPPVRLVAFIAALALLPAAAPFAQRGPARAEITPFVATDGVPAGATVKAALRVRLPEGYHVNSNKPRESFLIPVTLTVDGAPAVTATELVFPNATEIKQQGLDQPLLVFEHEFTIGVQLQVAADAQSGELVVPGKLRYQACDEATCYLPVVEPIRWSLKILATAARAGVAQHADVFDRIAFGHGEAPTAPATTSAPQAPTASQAVTKANFDDFEVLGTTGGYLDTAELFIKDSEAGVKQSGPFEGRGPLAILLIVFIGGLALNLTPCVLPMIPINLAIIGAGAQAGSRTRGLLLGGTYGLAMAVVYGVLGLIVILTAGTFGTINSSPWFNAGIALLFIVLATAMFDVIVIDFSRYSTAFNVGAEGRGTFLVAFGMGAVAALLAGACVAPVVIQVVLFSSNLYATGTTAALALPFVLGVGMAVPWPIAGAGIAALPRPGAWMVRIKQVFGIVILATALYYAWEAYELFSDRLGDPAQISAGVEEQLKAGWQASLDEGLAQAKREHKPVLIDMWATWCKNCGAMDVTTLKDPSVTSALGGYVKVKFQAENSDESPAKEVMSRFGAIGLPTYVILRPK